MFRQLFKPKWQRQQPEQRIQALEQLSYTNAKDAEIIAVLCRDSDTKVQQAAIKRCTDVVLLRKIGQEFTSAAPYVQTRIASLLENFEYLTKEDVLTAIKLEQDTQVLANTVITQTDENARRMAFKRLHYLADENALMQIAQDARDAETRFAAAEQLTKPESWRTLQRQSRDKRINQLAREKWREHQAAQQQLAEKKTARDAILTEVKQHQHRTIDNLYQARLTQWQQQWEDNKEGATEEEENLLAQYITGCTEHLRAHEAELAEQEAQANALLAQKKSINEYRTTLARFQEPDWESEIGHISAALTIQERYWASLTETAAPKSSTAQQFSQLQEQWKQLQNFITRYQNVLEEAQQADEAAAQELIIALNKDWPKHLFPPATLAAWLPVESATEKPSQAQPRPNTAPRDPLFHRLRSALSQRNLRQANRLWQRLQNELQEHPDSAREQRYAPLQEQLTELRDWHNFAAEPKKIALCEKMEALAKQTMNPEEKATAIQALHQEWRALMSSHQEADQALWDRFKAASDDAYEPCKEYFAELDKVRQKNLAQRQALCEQLEALVQKITTEEQTDWPALFEIRRQAPQAYREFQPIRFTEAKPTDERFSQVLRKLDAALKQATAEHRPAHEELLAALKEELAKTAYPEQLDTLKTIQQAWHNLPWLHPREYRQLHRQFRQQADKLFQQLQQQRQETRAQHTDNKRQLEAAIAAFSSMLTTLPADELRTQIQTLKAMPCPPRERQLAKAKEQLIATAEQRLQLAPLVKQQQALHAHIQALPIHDTSTEAAHTLVIAAEVISGVDSPAEDKARRMQWQLEQLPSAMTKGRSKPLQQLVALLDDGQTPLAQGLTGELQQRLLAAISNVALQ